MDVRRAGLLLGLAGVLAAAGCSGAAAPRAETPASHQAAYPSPTPTPSPSPKAEPAGPYVALGDSYTSGLGVEPKAGEPSGCGRSGVNYPSLVARAIGASGAGFTDVSCSGATTADLTAAQRTAGGTNGPQLDALSAATRLVTLGIGGNDAGFVGVVTECAAQGLKQVLGLVKGTDAPCRRHYTENGRDELQRRVETVGARLDVALRQIRERAPRAKVYVVGYPALLPADGAACEQTLGQGVSAGDLGFLREKEGALNTVLAEHAKAAGAAYVDTSTPSAGHDMCAGSGIRWVEPPLPDPGLAPVHPNALGQQGMAAAVLAAVRG
ncbi:SGNH/GDSL hydrolase family protein [Kitasatospora sp. NPDC002227]|uniref:SGNH/GDSL hydrolase family protein n=1 Tax=Kitasatospora sp. NPDC002227 TaxID=3154773 RepID=UPI00331E4CD9